MATADKIIDYCLKGIGEMDVDAPVEMTRAETLEIINQLYQNDVAKRLNAIAAHSYDGSDAAHTITNGVGLLPGDFLRVYRVYDGDANSHSPLMQIFSIEDKVADTAACTQYLLPNLTHIWIFGQTPSSTIKLYYLPRPAVLTDSSDSSPSALKPEFHLDIFVARVKEIYAMRLNNTYDALDMKALQVDLLNQIEHAHSTEKRDESDQIVRIVW